ncbi:MAG: bifunctional adenosylcobinamide kinase/adenosylcobinamide-phosphate guanylyltransferase [Sulfuricurvum sp.]|uniref:bifunctional adenosylcobinamide kinase/adenosylcobinamide-phosphate guanylyltransferase n=1 Tax=Sulfuricurvum sp. TaxID=2025608 RepID=UPI002733A442|nr:bifunctional adenosylcobinamide kinase/adenosylcobinamide-phosphate guanylyltransferase [Sulfuricurvum sp.]MDP3292710.1 bifunctional adenosylcobinamide kinase/adenosylcobinamide-phosphate guanylyltransferase [Sulfuricurvum sp.]
MKILYFGGQKSGKSSLAEAKALAIATAKPTYLATYDHSFGDSEMGERIDKHRSSRGEEFITLEESRDLSRVIEPHQTYLVDCISMWILNRMNESEEELTREIEALGRVDANIVFVLNDVGSGVIPNDPISRRYVDLSGIIGQTLARICDEVYEVKLGLERRLK